MPVLVGQITTVDASLKLGSLQEVVTVTANALAIEQSSSSLGYVTPQNLKKFTNIISAILARDLESLEDAIYEGEDVNAKDDEVMLAPTALHIAALAGEVRFLRLLLDEGADPMALWCEMTPLEVASRYNRTEAFWFIKDYLKKGK